MEEKSQIELLIDKAQKYSKTSFELFRLKTIDKSTDAIANTVSFVAIICFGSLFFIFLSFGLALWIGEILNKSSYGFFIVAAFYGVIAFVLFLVRQRFIIIPIKNLLIKFFDKNIDKQDE